MSQLHPLPTPPSTYVIQQDTSASESSSQQNIPNQQQGQAQLLLYLSGYQRYMSDFHAGVIPRIEKYEKNQEKILSALGREKIIEDTTRRLLHINFVISLLLPIILTIYFILFCHSYAPENVKKFFEDYKIIFSVLSGSYALSMIWPIFHIYQYNKRLDAIEKN